MALDLAFELDTQYAAQSTFDAASLYSALPISQGSACIRLLRVLAAPAHDPDSPIRCEIFAEKLKDKPEYCAISYVWGMKAPSPKYIFCNGVALTVTDNCYAALQNLRTRLTSYVIWIDALCINQEDEYDKEQQIPLMDSIYANAATTYIWLGEGDATTAKVFDYLSSAGFLRFYFDGTKGQPGEVVKPRLMRAVWWYIFTRWSFGRSPLPYKAAPAPRSLLNIYRSVFGPSFDDINSVLDQVWMTRIWTYQEAILANNPVVVCGNSLITWDRLTWSVIFVNTLTSGKISLKKWMELMHSRAMVRVRDHVGADAVLNHLADYRAFCVSLQERYRNIRSRAWWTVYLYSCCSSVVTGLGMLVSGLSEAAGITNNKQVLPRWALVLTLNTLPILFVAMTHFFAPSAPYPASHAGSRRIRMAETDNIHLHILHSMVWRRASNPKDIYYGLHSTLKRFPRAGLPLPTIDYNLTLNQIYKRLTVYLIKRTGTIIPLTLAAHHLEPSWVPDYSQDFGYCPLLGLNSHTGLLTDRQVVNEIYERRFFQENHYPTWRFADDNDSLLALKAHKVSTVTHTSPLFLRTSVTFDVAEVESHRKNFELMQRWRHMHDYGDGQRKISQLYGVLLNVFSNLSSNTEVPYISPRSLEAYEQLLGNCHSTRKTYDFHPRTSSQRDIIRTHVTVCNFLAKSKLLLMQTTDSASDAATLGDVCVGDELHVVEGINTPLALRKSGNYYRIVSRVDIRLARGYWKEVWHEGSPPQGGDNNGTPGHFERQAQHDPVVGEDIYIC